MINISTLKSKASRLLKIPAINAIRGVPMPDAMGEDAQQLIARLICERRASLIARVGETEGRATLHYLKNRLSKPLEGSPYATDLKDRLKLLAGYFPINEDSIDRLANIYLQAISSIAVYAAWTPHDALLCPKTATKVRLVDLDPFFTAKRWSLALKGKSVCFVSPFIDTMQTQYENRTKHFRSPVLPEMDISFVRAPMTQCEADIRDQNWESNLEEMNHNVARTGSEVVIIGAGAYGLPLGSAATKNGSTAIVLGGSIQLMFGIAGKRWENDPQYRRLMNSNWVRPGQHERPPGFQNFEIKGGAYW